VEKLSIAFPNTSQTQIVEKINNWFQKLDEKEFKEEV
jgi:pyruvate/2-oxoacid:ferredoxin oxidoreductase alpha subunit